MSQGKEPQRKTQEHAHPGSLVALGYAGLVAGMLWLGAEDTQQRRLRAISQLLILCLILCPPMNYGPGSH